MSPPASLPHSLSSSLLWEILTHTNDSTFVAFALCCRGTLHLLKPALCTRQDSYFLQKAREVWERNRHLFFSHDFKEIRQMKYALLRWTACDGKFKLIQWMVEKYPPTLDEVYFDFYCALRCAASSGCLPLVQWMVEKWPPFSFHISYNSNFLLRCAARSGNLELVQWLVEKWPPTLEHVYWNGYRLLRCAAWSGNLDLVKWLVGKWPPRLGHINKQWWSRLLDKCMSQYLSQLELEVSAETQDTGNSQ